MKNKLVFTAGMAVGYVLGTRAGRESYEQLRTKARELWNSPKVQDTVSSTTDTIKSKAPNVPGSLKGVLKKSGSGSDNGAVAPQESGKDAEASGDLPLDLPPVVTSMHSGTTGPSGTSGPSGGDPAHVDATPFQRQDEDTRPDLGKDSGK